VEELESEAGGKGAYFYYLSKKKESGRLLPLSFCSGLGRGESSNVIGPTRNGRGNVVGIQPIVNFLPRRLGECGLHPAHYFVHHFGEEGALWFERVSLSALLYKCNRTAET
jgi:hypothetical protein